MEKHWSRASLPVEIKNAIKPLVFPTDRELEIAQRFVEYKTDLVKLNGSDRKRRQDRGGMVKLMAQLYNATYGLKKPELRVKACRDLQESKKLRPQTMLNYLSIFLLFVEYCYLLKEVVAQGNEMERMIDAIADASKVLTTAATEDYRKQAAEMLGRVPANDQVRDRYKRTLKILTDNLSSNELPYKTQQVLNFFLLQGQINTRFVKK